MERNIHKNYIHKKIFIIILLMLSIISFSDNLVIFHAGSLTNILNELKNNFEKIHPETNVRLVSSGSLVLVRKISELNQNADLAFVADYSLIPKFLYPKYAKYNIIFSNNSIVLAYTDKSKYNDIITKDNWYNIIFKKGVIYSHSNPNLDPCGYRTLMTLQLAEKYYNLNGLYNNFINSKNRMILKKSVDIIAYLEANEIDYAFLYKSNAIQSNLKYIDLPNEINLSSNKFDEIYKNVFVEVPRDGEKTKIYGKAINYSFTILENANNKKDAIEFIKFIYSELGKKIFEDKFMNLFVDVDNPNNLPDELKNMWGY
ncbi:extracellular solute-binding protein [Marinitoga sp. 38H-ov]|uniref:extracellular solute-binding protein n=1 Tax=Marinitoga sp. 38H-ov TaxID=1755814 RepID=UPI0013ED549A|nr:extracellular solute-binding protein [Marinitoga sp. 38H-ov]KAF2956937.1 hypothetical protein AS160_02825 [Marinitoga sp. 38H-ov]